MNPFAGLPTIFTVLGKLGFELKRQEDIRRYTLWSASSARPLTDDHALTRAVFTPALSIQESVSRPRHGDDRACRNSMRDRNITAEDLFPFASTVDSGVAELVRKQEAGWAYIK